LVLKNLDVYYLLMNESINFESKKEVSVTLPALETLKNPEIGNSPWSEDIRNNPELIRQTKIRSEARDSLTEITESTSDITTSIDEALSSGEVKDVDAVRFYLAYTELLLDDSTNNRIVLYFPFELLPNLNPDKNLELSTEVLEAQKSFVDAYKTAWYSLLSTHELRADYADGDVVEVEYQTEPHSLVVKAAHIIPMLIEYNVLTLEEVLDILENTPDSILQQSIADALFTMKGGDQISEEQLDRITNSPQHFVSNVGIILKNTANTPETEGFIEEDNLRALINDLEKLKNNLEESIANVDDNTMTEGRKNWLIEQKTNDLIEDYALRISVLIKEDTLTPEALMKLIDEKSSESSPLPLLVVESIRIAIESFTKEESGSAHEMFVKHSFVLGNLKASDNKQVQHNVERALHHFYSLGVLNEEELLSYDIKPSSLDIDPSKVTETMSNEIDIFTDITKRIESHPELSRLVYPVIIFLGSRMKGYAKEDADVDVAIFVRPETEEKDRSRIQSLISEVLSEVSVDEKVMEFWLDEEGDGLTIKNYENPDPQRGDNTLTHPLTGTWCGNERIVEELYQRLMPQYLYSEDKTVLGEDLRQVWLKELEHNILQYRLMHKGYDRFNAAQGGVHSSDKAPIDGDSVFYDSGYRRLATKLFTDHVFLPQLQKK